MIHTIKEARNIMLRKINNRLRNLKKRYGNREIKQVWSWENYCDFQCYWYNNDWTPDFIYHEVVKKRVNDCLDKILLNGIYIGDTQYFFRDPLENKSIDFLNWNFKVRKDHIIFTTLIDHSNHCEETVEDDYNKYLDDLKIKRNISMKHRLECEKIEREKRIQHYVDDYNNFMESEESEYDVECFGKVWGCPEKTNGTQFCCKHYCPFEFTESPSSLEVIEDW